MITILLSGRALRAGVAKAFSDAFTDSSSPQISAILVGHFTVENAVSANLPKNILKNCADRCQNPGSQNFLSGLILGSSLDNHYFRGFQRPVSKHVCVSVSASVSASLPAQVSAHGLFDSSWQAWILCRGGCSGWGVQWIGVVLYSKLVYNVI